MHGAPIVPEAGPLPDAADVVVVGAGPVGLLTAVFLARQGHRPLVVDEGTGPVGESRATDLHASSVSVLARAGLLDDVLALGVPTTAMSVVAGGRAVAELDWDGLEHPHPYVLTVPQCTTEAVLGSALATAGVVVARQHRLERLGPAGQRRARLHLATPNGPAAVEARFVVGCDGARSTARTAAGIGWRHRTYPGRYAIADVEADLGPSEGLRLHLHVDGFLQVLPMPIPGFVRLFAPLPDGVGSDGVLDALAGIVAARTGVELQPRSVRYVASFALGTGRADRWRDGPVVLAGDAAHTWSPVGGQGLNTDIADAEAVAGALSSVLRGADESALDRYATERRRVARRRALLVGAAHRLVAARRGDAVRAAALRTAAALPPVRRWVVRTVAGV